MSTELILGIIGTITGIIGTGTGIYSLYLARVKIKREDATTMRDRVYGPIFETVSEILENIEQVNRPNWELANELEEIRKSEYLFQNMKPDLKSRFYALAKRLEKYQITYSATHTQILRKIRDAVAESHRIDIGVTQERVWLRLEKAKDAGHVGAIPLEQAIMRREHPSDFIRTNREMSGDVNTDVRIGGEKGSLDDYELLYSHVLDEMEKESLYHEEREQRESLVKELRVFLDQVRPLIAIEQTT